MRLANVVRVGGKAALLVFFACLNFAFADTLNYFYGYSNPNFGVYQGSDAFSSQNVSLSPQVPMVTVQSQNQTSTFGSTSPSIFTQASTASAGTSANGSQTSGYTVLTQTYGYSVPATQGSVSGSSSAVVSTQLSAGYSAPITIASASTYTPAIVNSSNSSYSGGPSVTPTVFAPSIGMVPSFSMNPGVTVGSSPGATTETGGYIGIQIMVAPRYESTITAPSTVSSSVTVNLGPSSIQPLYSISNPEPGTIGLFSAGLALLILKLRCRS